MKKQTFYEVEWFNGKDWFTWLTKYDRKRKAESDVRFFLKHFHSKKSDLRIIKTTREAVK